jgi:hypothetical protein
MCPEDLRLIEPGIVTTPEGNGGTYIIAARSNEPNAQPIGFGLGGPDLLRVPADAAKQSAGHALCNQAIRMVQDVVRHFMSDDDRQLIVASSESEQGSRERHISAVRKGVRLRGARQPNASGATRPGAQGQLQVPRIAQNAKPSRTAKQCLFDL